MGAQQPRKGEFMKLVTGVGIAVAFAVTGCAMMDPRDTGRPPSNCGPGACQFDVTVTSCTQIAVSKEPIVVAPGHRGPIQWRLDARSGWEFTGGGIVIHQGTDREFEPAPGSASVVTWNNNHRNANKTYKYDVVVMKSSTGQVCRWDPSIMN
jgi:hypothetical protein